MEDGFFVDSSGGHPFILDKTTYPFLKIRRQLPVRHPLFRVPPLHSPLFQSDRHRLQVRLRNKSIINYFNDDKIDWLIDWLIYYLSIPACYRSTGRREPGPLCIWECKMKFRPCTCSSRFLEHTNCRINTSVFLFIGKVYY